MEGIINPLAVRDYWRCSSCGHEWLDYELDEPDAFDVTSKESARTCPRCHSTQVGPLAG
jgi:DNA-directed RNA polymerase subunit RPC12/RpoP